MPRKESTKIGQLLIKKGLITEEQLLSALEEQESSGGFLGSILIDLGYVSEDDLYPILAEQFDTEYVRLKNIKIPPEVLGSIPIKFISQYRIMPVSISGNTLTVAMSDPKDILVLDNLRILLKKNVKAVLASANDIIDAINNCYGVGAETIERIAPEIYESAFEIPITEDIVELAEGASIAKFVNQIILQAERERATDIHIEPYETELKVRYRIDGMLYEMKMPPNIKKFQSAIASRIKVMARLNIAERRIPQDGRVKIKVRGRDIDLRISILPTMFGEAVVLRLLSPGSFLSLEHIGMHEDNFEAFLGLIKKPHGIILVSGPTGSGKTTTLYATLSRINDKKKKILTIEDPIEYQIEGVQQMQVHPQIDFTFARGLRSMLRHDPDIMMVGEIRDYETAEITIRVALTGHLVFSTIHTNDASGGVTRLIDMGIEPFLVASSVNAFMAQRLVRVICPDCKREVSLDGEVLRELEIPPEEDMSNISIYEGKGCDKCRNTGYRGRTAIYEILEVTDPIRELIMKRTSSDQIKKKAVFLGMNTLRQDGWRKIKEGITTPSEVLRVS